MGSSNKLKARIRQIAALPVLALRVSTELRRRAAEMGIGKPTFQLDIGHIPITDFG